MFTRAIENENREFVDIITLKKKTSSEYLIK